VKVLSKSVSGTVMKELTKIPINEEFNRNVLIVGTSGSGKSFLGKIVREERRSELTFVYKEDGIFKEPIQIREYRHDIMPSLDRNSFIDAFIDTQNLSEIGIMGSSLTTALYAVYGSGSLEEIKRRIRTKLLDRSSIETMVYSFIYGKLSLYYPDRRITDRKQLTAGVGGVDMEIEKIAMEKESSVLSFAGMTQEEQIFFSDYLLRVLMRGREIRGVMIDEIHRLKQLNAGIISEVVREIRHKGYIIGITQSLSDLPDDLVNNFGSIFQFHSTHFRDLEKLRIIDAELPSTVMRLRPHEFVELRRYVDEVQKGYKSIYEVVE